MSFSHYEYPYLNNNSFHHHAYLMSPLLQILSAKKCFSQQKLRVLDLGCGNGSLSHLIAKEGYEVVGIEESKQGIEIARQSFPDCHFIEASVYNLPYQNLENSFDIVLSIEVIEHLFYPRELLRGARKYLKKDGQLIITTPYHGYFKNLAVSLSGGWDNHFTALWDGGHIKFFSVKTMTRLLKDEGYTDIGFKFAGRLPCLWKSMLCFASPSE